MGWLKKKEKKDEYYWKVWDSYLLNILSDHEPEEIAVQMRLYEQSGQMERQARCNKFYENYSSRLKEKY